MTVSVANKLVELRKKNGLSQEELAEKLGISRQAVSKWERAEASPDTDNLVLLARLYGISLDELLLDPASTDDSAPLPSGEGTTPESKSGGKPEDTGEPDESNKNERVKISWDGIHISDYDSEVHIDRSGIFIKDKKEGKVEIGDGGVYVNGEPVDCDFGEPGGGFSFDGEAPDHDPEETRRRRTLKRMEHAVTPVVLVVYLLIGALFNLWHPGWVIFITIPVFTSFFEALRKRRPHNFAYPVLVCAAYLLMGFAWNLWHPGWVIFVTIPLYYTLLPAKPGKKD